MGNSGGDYNADGYDYDAPNAPSFGNHLPGQSKKSFLNGLFPASAFPAPPLGQEGDLGRNTYDSPGYSNIDLNVAKLFYVPWLLHEKATLGEEVRGEAFNLLDRVNLTSVDGDMVDPLFAHATSQQPGAKHTTSRSGLFLKGFMTSGYRTITRPVLPSLFS